jgi:hypothetical protein
MSKQKRVKKKDMHIGCLTCSSVPESGLADMDMSICVGFGSAFVTRDGMLCYDGEAELRADIAPKTVADIEKWAKESPDRDWRIVLNGPLHGETYQRQGVNKWVMVESNDGFA